jgi:hypothetical protein
MVPSWIVIGDAGHLGSMPAALDSLLTDSRPSLHPLYCTLLFLPRQKSKFIDLRANREKTKKTKRI